MKYLKFVLAFCLLSVMNLSAQVPAFPTAEGFGKWATGGRGGQVVEVTNLNDSGEGSLRWALTQYPKEPLTVVFRVSGVIHLKSQLRCSRTTGLTIAGQTAPGDGICIRGHKVNFGGCQNVIIRHMRMRMGLGEDEDGNPKFIDGGSIGIENASNWIIDHCTFGWSGEENMTIYDNDLTTIQWCLVHEGLYDAGHGKGQRSYASQWGGQRATYHHNLLAHNKSRSPRFNGARSNDKHVLIEYTNNVNYNWGNHNSCYGGDMVEGVSHKVNFINNYYKPGPARPATKTSSFVHNSYNGGQKTTQIPVWWMSGNVMEGNADYTKYNFKGLNVDEYTSKGIRKSQMMAGKAFEISDPVNAQSAQDVYNSVLAGAGAFPRDAVDARIINEVKTGTATCSGSIANVAPGIIDHPDDAGGYPTYKTYNEVTDADHDGMDDAWETKNGLNPGNAADRNLILKSGYTALEAYLCSLCGETIAVEFAQPYDIVVAQDGSGDYTTIQAALDAVPENGTRTKILVKNGTYEEKLFIGTRWSSSNKVVSLIGEDVDGVVIVWDDYSGKEIAYPGKDGTIKADGSTCGTFTINAPDFYMENITVKNPSTQAQAIALCQKGDRHVLKNCKILGNQDTHRTKKGRRYFYYQCEIEGGVDFIYAGGTCYFYQCNIVSNRGGFVTAPEDVPNFEKLSNGKNLYFGFFFNDCDLTAKEGVSAGSCYLGRPWGEKSGSVFMNCRLGSHINKAGWSKMGDETWKDCSLMEYKSRTADGSALADVSQRVSWSMQVSEDDRYYLMGLKYIYNRVNANSKFDPLPSVAAPQAPAKLSVSGNMLSWTAVPEAESYAIYADGRLLDFAATNSYCDIKSTGSPKYQVKAIGTGGNMSSFNGGAVTPTAAELDSILSPDYRVKLSTSLSDDKAGSISIEPKQPSYDKNAEVRLTAQANYAYRFVKWVDENGQTLSTQADYLHKMEREIAITAVFRRIPLYTLNFEADINSSFANKNLPQALMVADKAPCQMGDTLGYEEGEVLQVWVKDHPIFRFTAWTDGQADNLRTLTMDGHKNLKAKFVQEDFLAAWNFEQTQYDYYTPDWNPADIMVEINLIDGDGNYITWDKTSAGYFGSTAIKDNSGKAAYFDMDAYVEKQENIYLWSKLRVENQGFAKYLLEYSLDYGESYKSFATVDVPALDTWTTAAAAIPAEALQAESFRIRWIPDYTSAALTSAAGTKAAALQIAATSQTATSQTATPQTATSQASGASAASGTVLSDVVLLPKSFTSLSSLPNSLQVWMHDGILYLSCNEEVSEIQVFDMCGRSLMQVAYTQQVDMRSLPDGLYLLKITQNGHAASNSSIVKLIKK